jgi:hypothetical protein
VIARAELIEVASQLQPSKGVVLQLEHGAAAVDGAHELVEAIV